MSNDANAPRDGLVILFDVLHAFTLRPEDRLRYRHLDSESH
jgi:hypothetical protein